MAVALARKPLPKPDPQSDPRFRKITDQLKQGAVKAKAHVPAAKKASDAAKASKGPPNERLASGKAKQVDKIKDAKEGKPEESSFLSILRAEIAKAMPKTLKETESFDQSAQAMKGGLKGNVAQQKDTSTKDVSGASKQTPGPAGEAKVEQPLPKEGAPQAPTVDAAEGMPAPKSDADVSLQDSKQNADEQMKEAEVTTPQLQKANDPRFSAVITAKDQVAQNADTGPGKYRSAEKAAVSSAAAGATSDVRKGAAAMLGVRGGANTKVLTRQQKQRAADEAKRKAVVDKIESIYAATKARVDARLAALDPEVNGMFDSGVDAALNTMTTFVNAKIRAYKIDRYLSIPIVGAARWIRDQFKGLPDEVNAFYEQGRAVFQAAMDALIVRVAAVVEKRLKEAKAEVARGQAEIKAFVASQPKDLQQVAQQAQTDVASRFAELEAGIEEKKNSLAQSLAQKYKEGFDKANEALKKIQDENKGLVAAFVEKLGEIIKILREFKARLMSILRKGADTIKLIIADPVGFIGNLIAAVKGGIQAFVGNIWTHLKAGFMKWLFGNLPPGVTIPTDLSLPSVFKLVMGVLGITYDKMRAKAVKLIGNTAVTVIEKLVGYIYTLVTGGPAALWEQVKGDLASLKSMVIDAIQNWLIETVVKQAVAKIVSMFNPAGAIIQAIIAIYNVVMFVVEKAAQIMDFVEAVINSVHAIATGAIGGAIKWIEQALARTIPIVIGFLARLIGLGGISQKIRDFIVKVQTKVDQAIDKALKVIVDKIKKLFGKGKDNKEENPKVRFEKGIAAAQALAGKEKKKASAGGLAAGLAGIKAQYGFTKLELVIVGGKAVIDAALNPAKKVPVDDTEFVTAADGVTIIIPVKPPAVDRKLMQSNDGNTRLFGVDAKGFKMMVYVVSKKAWQTVPSDERVREMEKQARQWLQSQNSGFVSLVNAEKDPSARGFDVAGLQPGEAGAPERMVVGEAKGSFQGAPIWFQAPKFTAIQGDPLAANIRGTRRENPEMAGRIDSALASGNVTIIVFVNKDARISKRALSKLERSVRKDLKAYILATFPGSDADIKKIMKNVIIKTQRI